MNFRAVLILDLKIHFEDDLAAYPDLTEILNKKESLINQMELNTSKTNFENLDASAHSEKKLFLNSECQIHLI